MARPGPVLIVSDDPVLRDLLRNFLVNERLRAEEADTPDEALARCRERRLGLLLVDAIVGEREALIFLSRVASAQPEGMCPPVVLLTGSAPLAELVAHEAVREAISAPFATPSLLESIRRHLGDRGASHTRLRAADAPEPDAGKASGDDR